MTEKKASNTHDCRVCKHRILLYRMIVCKIKTLGENPRITDQGYCDKYEYKFDYPKVYK